MRNEQERLAREWAEQVKSVPEINYGPQANAAADHILATTPPPSMADVEWDGEKHFLAGATLNEGDSAEEMVMCGYTRDGEIYVVEPNPGRGKRGYWPMPGDLTPNGKRYELREIIEPEHPEALCTVEDYEDAPVGTIAARNHFYPVVKRLPGVWLNPYDDETSSEKLAGDSRTVLRWGWGE